MEVKQQNGSKLIGEMKQVYSTYLNIISNSDSAFFNQWHLEHLLRCRIISEFCGNIWVLSTMEQDSRVILYVSPDLETARSIDLYQIYMQVFSKEQIDVPLLNWNGFKIEEIMIQPLPIHFFKHYVGDKAL